MPRYSVPLTAPDGEVFWHPVTASSPGAARTIAVREAGGWGNVAGVPLALSTGDVRQTVTFDPTNKSQPWSIAPTDPAAYTSNYVDPNRYTEAAAATSSTPPQFQDPGWVSGLDAAGVPITKFDPEAAAAKENPLTSPRYVAPIDFSITGEQFDPKSSMLFEHHLDTADLHSEELGDVRMEGDIRPWSERVRDIKVEYDPNFTGGGSKGRRLIVPLDMWRFDSENQIGDVEIEQAMRYLAASEGSDTYKALIGQFLDSATSFLKDKQTWRGGGGTRRYDFVDPSLKDGTYEDSEEFINTRDSILTDVIGKREERTVSTTGDVGDSQPWDHLPERYHNQKMYDKYAALSPEEKKVVENPAISEFFQDRPKEFLALSPYLRDIVLSGLAVDHKTLEAFHEEEAKEEAREFHDVGKKGDPNLHGMQTFEPEDNLDDFTTFAQETGQPGAVWEPIDETGFVEDIDTDVGPDITLPPDALTYKPAPPAMVPPPGGAPPPPGGPEGGPGGPGGPGGFDPNLSFEANMQGVLDDRGLFEVSPTAGYRRAFGNVFGEGFGRRGPIGGYLQGLQDPLTAAFQGGAIRNLLNPQAVDAAGAPLPGQSFQNFLSQATQAEGGLGSVWNQALQDVGTFRGMQQADIPVAAQQYFAPQSLQDVGQAARLMGAAQRARYSPLVSGMFRPQSYEDLYADYVLQNQERAQMGEDMPANFYDFAATRFGL